MIETNSDTNSEPTTPINFDNLTLSPNMVETAKEIRIGLPTPFDGTRENLQAFLQECGMYFDLNSNVYDTETKRVIFMLSYMKGGTAQAWKESFLTTASESTPSTYGTIDQLISKMKTAFE